MIKTLIMVPGFGETTREKPYKKIKDLAVKSGMRVLEINPVWNYKTMSDWYFDSQKKIKDIDPKNTTAVGFSFGAYIILLLSREFSFNKSILCSLSPFFKEQLKHTPDQAKKFLGKRRMKDFSKYSIKTKLISSKNIFLFGDKDWNFAIDEVKSFTKENDYKFIEIKDVGHELNDDYIDCIGKYL